MKSFEPLDSLLKRHSDLLLNDSIPELKYNIPLIAYD